MGENVLTLVGGEESELAQSSPADVQMASGEGDAKSPPPG